MRFVCSVLAVTAFVASILVSPSIHAQAPRPVSGVVAASSGAVEIAFTDETGQQIGRSAVIGDPIYLNDEIRTGPETSLQILLKDQTVFSIGPNTSIVFDEFVYDPASGAEPALSAKIQKGVFKFISGKIATKKPGAVSLKLPNATASIRGTTVAGRVNLDGGSDIVLLAGAIAVSSDAAPVPVDIFQSGWGTSVSAAGSIEEPFIVPQDVLDGILEVVEVALVQQTEPEQDNQDEQSGDEEGDQQEGEGGEAEAGATPLTPETVETIEEIVTLVSANVATDDAGNINIATLADYVLSSGLAEQLNISPEDLVDDANSNLNIEARLLSYLISGGQPLFLTAKQDGSDIVFGNPPSSSEAQQLALYNSTYAGLVSETYAGSVTFNKTALAVSPGSTTITVPESYDSRGFHSFASTRSAGALLDYNVVLNYDTSAITGTMDVSSMVMEGQTYDDVNANISVTSFTADSSLSQVDLHSVSGLSGSGGDSASLTFTGGFGSITDGNDLLDGLIGSFNLEVMNTTSPEYAEMTGTPSGTRSFFDEAGQVITFDSDWTDNGDGSFSTSNVTWNLGSRVAVDDNGDAIDGVLSNDGATLTYNSINYSYTVNSDGPDYFVNPSDVNDQIYVYNGVNIPSLKVEQYQIGTQ